MYEKLVIITRKTRLQELIVRFNTHAQAKFYIEHSGGNFAEYEREDYFYRSSLNFLRKTLNFGLKLQIVDRELLPNFVFGKQDIVAVLGQDGLVANTAKYAGDLPIAGINPDPARYDGILVPIKAAEAASAISSLISGQASIKEATLAEAVLNDGQRLLAFNDLFIGAGSHVSARYRLEFAGKSEWQSSSGLIVSTGAGSTGWLSSVFNMVSSISQFVGRERTPSLKLDWQSADLIFVVREPFVSRHSTADVTAGILHEGSELIVESQMPCGGTIFSDGIESDYLAFNCGATARVHAAQQKARLVMPLGKSKELPGQVAA